MYRQLVNSLTLEVRTDCIQRVIDTAFIPCDEMNKDYREYLEWEAMEGNSILPPEE